MNLYIYIKKKVRKTQEKDRQREATPVSGLDMETDRQTDRQGQTVVLNSAALSPADT